MRCKIRHGQVGQGTRAGSRELYIDERSKSIKDIE